MTARIHLVRHGRSAYVHQGRWIHARALRDYEDAYDVEGIRDDDEPPAAIRALAADALLVASDMRRAIESCRRLAPDRQPLVSPLLREIRLDPPLWIPARLPAEVWGSIVFLKWTWRLSRGHDLPDVRRARDAVRWLEEHATGSPSIVVITHGAFRRILAAGLVAAGWNAGRERRGYENWGAWSFER
jgi:broad specificity phosphatase PhoE